MISFQLFRLIIYGAYTTRFTGSPPHVKVSSIAYLLFADSDKGYQVRLIKRSIFIMLAIMATDEIIMFPPYAIHAIIAGLACNG